jgi:hypothetical protein
MATAEIRLIHPNQSNTDALNPENSMPNGTLGGASSSTRWVLSR